MLNYLNIERIIHPKIVSGYKNLLLLAKLFRELVGGGIINYIHKYQILNLNYHEMFIHIYVCIPTCICIYKYMINTCKVQNHLTN